MSRNSARAGVLSASLFGSVARGEDSAHDVDMPFTLASALPHPLGAMRSALAIQARHPEIAGPLTHVEHDFVTRDR